MIDRHDRRIRRAPLRFVAVSAVLAVVLAGCTSHVSGTPTMASTGAEPVVADPCLIAPPSAVTTLDRRLLPLTSATGTSCRYRDAAADTTLTMSSLNAANSANSPAALRAKLTALAPSLLHNATELDLGADSFYLSGSSDDLQTWLSAVVWRRGRTVFELTVTAPFVAYWPEQDDVVALAHRADAVATGRLTPAPPSGVSGGTDPPTGPGDPFPPTGYLACLFLTPSAAKTLIPDAVHDVGVQDAGSYFDCGYDADHDQRGPTVILTLLPAAATGNGSITEKRADEVSTGNSADDLTGLGTGAFLSTTPSSASGVLLDIFFVKDHYLFDLTGLSVDDAQTITPDSLGRLATLLYRSPTR